MSLLDIKNLTVDFPKGGKWVRVVDGVSLKMDTNDYMAIVGESGSGKSVTSLALMGLIQSPGKVNADRMTWNGQDMLTMKASQKRRLLGNDLAMIFQDPLSSLNPVFTVGDQLDEAIRIHDGGSRKARLARAIEMLDKVGIPDAKARLKCYPHQLSGGMCQRVMIAMAICCRPKLLIADEPTTALDVTIQAQILELINELNRDGMAVILITHDLAVVAETAKKVAVMYAGQIVEEGLADNVLHQAKHPYTEALLNALPEHQHGERLQALPGQVPLPEDFPIGCRLQDRCAYRQSGCERPQSLEMVDDEWVRCHVRTKS